MRTLAAAAVLFLFAVPAQAQTGKYRIESMDYEVHSIRQVGNTTVLDITFTNRSAIPCDIAIPDLMHYRTTSAFDLIRCHNKASKLPSKLLEDTPQRCSIVFPGTGHKIRLYGKGFLGSATHKDITIP